MEYTHHYDSPLGGITLASDGKALTGLWFDGQEHFAETLDREHEEKGLPVFEEAVRWLDLYFSGQDPGFVPKLALRATPFRKAVWETLLTIPYGTTVTYGEIAERMRLSRGSARAVGGAVGHNAVSLIIPCHRVVGTDGSLTGYAGGTDRKARLLDMERIKGQGMAREKITIREERIPAGEYVEFLKRTDLGSQYPKERFAERIEKLVKNVSVSLVARNEEGLAVGVLFGLTDFCYWLYVTDLGVDRNYERQGIATRLMKQAHEIAGGEKDIAVYLVANEDAVPFYEKLGMKRADDVMKYNHIEWTEWTV